VNVSTAQRVQEMIEDTVQALGVELWGVEFVSQGKNSVLRVYIDSEQGVVIEDCERVSRQVSALLDVEDPVSGEYALEVSSPGLDRPLFRAAHYARYIGSEVNIKLRGPVDGRRKFKGVINGVTEQELSLQCEGETMLLALAQIEKARLNF